MFIEIDFNSDEALYLQLRNQIVIGIANRTLKNGDTLPSVRKMADEVGINMHTVNKAYSLLKTEGFVTIDRRIGAIIKIDLDRNKDREEIYENINLILAKAYCKKIKRYEIHNLVDRLYDSYEETLNENR